MADDQSFFIYKGLPEDIMSNDVANVRRLKTESLAVSPGGKLAFNTEFGEQTVGFRIDDISVNFHYGISTKDTMDRSSGTGSVSNIGSDAAVNVGTGIGTGELSSIDAVRYRAGHESLTMITHDQTGLEIGVDVQQGILNDDDGLAIGSQGTEKGCWFIEGGNENFINQSDFNIDKLDGTGPSRFNWDITKRNLFMITFGYLSIAPIRFYIATGETWQEFHKIIVVNQQAVGHLKNPTLPLAMRVRRLAGTGSDMQVKSGSWRGGTIGPEHQTNASDRTFDITASRTGLPSINVGANPNTFHNMFTLSSANLFNGKNNHIRAEVIVANFVADTNKSIEFVVIINGAIAGNDAFVDIDSSNSVMSSSIDGTVDGQTSGAATVLGRLADRRTDTRGTGIYIRPNDTLTLGARGIGGANVTGDISASFRWIEEF